MTERAGTDSLNITYEEDGLIDSDDNNIKNQLLLKNIPSSDKSPKLILYSLQNGQNRLPVYSQNG